MGRDISPDRNGRRAQDIEVKGIRPEGYRLAIRLAGIKPKRVLSDAQRAALQKAQAASPLLRHRAPEHSPALERDRGAGGDVW